MPDNKSVDFVVNKNNITTYEATRRKGLSNISVFGFNESNYVS
jgi:hypothetical protein